MPYAIKFMKLAEVIETTVWGRSFETATRHARDHFQLHRTRSGATHVDIHDAATGEHVFSHPNGLSARKTWRPQGLR